MNLFKRDLGTKKENNSDLFKMFFSIRFKLYKCIKDLLKNIIIAESALLKRAKFSFFY